MTRDGASAEVTIDEVSVMDAQRVESAFVEIEVELKNGEPATLARIAKDSSARGRVRPTARRSCSAS